jgi:hypothetical protein
MSKDIIEALRFYLDNNLDEVVAENSQNYFAQKDKIKKPIEVKKIEAKKPVVTNTPPIQNFVRPQFSTSEALSTLAKKSLQIPASDQKFQSLNEIVAKAKKAADGPPKPMGTPNL